jgi:hypothetical protein
MTLKIRPVGTVVSEHDPLTVAARLRRLRTRQSYVTATQPFTAYKHNTVLTMPVQMQ